MPKELRLSNSLLNSLYAGTGRHGLQPSQPCMFKTSASLIQRSKSFSTGTRRWSFSDSPKALIFSATSPRTSRYRHAHERHLSFCKTASNAAWISITASIFAEFRLFPVDGIVTLSRPNDGPGALDSFSVLECNHSGVCVNRFDCRGDVAWAMRQGRTVRHPRLSGQNKGLR